MRLLVQDMYDRISTQVRSLAGPQLILIYVAHHSNKWECKRCTQINDDADMDKVCIKYEMSTSETLSKLPPL